MKLNWKGPDALLNDLTAEIRGEVIDPAAVKAATDRVWPFIRAESNRMRVERSEDEHLNVVQIKGCADFQRLIPSYKQGGLSGPRRLLLEDHTRECLVCRKALKQYSRVTSQAGQAARLEAQPDVRQRPVALRVGIAVGAIILIGVAALFGIINFQPVGVLHVTVQAADGQVYLVSDSEVQPLSVGDRVSSSQRIRTAKAAGAVIKLNDGSLVEMKERSELSVSDSRKGVVVDLARGNIIVQATRQDSRNLLVSARDCLVSVTGTIFSINSGVKGSRISVIEGHVDVDYSGNRESLNAGQQLTTSQGIASKPVLDDIAWSRDAARYLKLLADFADRYHGLEEEAAHPRNRFSTRLLDLQPESTVFYIALPNLNEALIDSNRLIQEQIQQNDALRQWWESRSRPSGTGPGLSEILGTIDRACSYFGDEIAISIAMNSKGSREGMLVMAELSDPAGFRAFIQNQTQGHTAVPSEGLLMRLIEDASEPISHSAGSADHREIFISIQDNIFVASEDLKRLRSLESLWKSPAVTQFGETAFHSQISNLYKEGAGIILAANLKRIISQPDSASSFSQSHKERAEARNRLGISDLEHLILEIKSDQGSLRNRAVLTFAEPRRGISSWLAPPGPMGSLEFISPDAKVVAAFVVDKPGSMIHDLLASLKNIDPEMWDHLKEFEAKTSAELLADFAEPLGGEFAFAVDGPLLPTLSWKAIFEVYDPARLQRGIEQVVEEINQSGVEEGKPGLAIERTELGGRAFYQLRFGDHGLSLSYAFANGYLIVGPSRALVDRAIRYRQSGYTLFQSSRFTSVLPEDRGSDFSAFFYHDLGSLLDGSSQPKEVHAGRGLQATLVYANQLGNRIVFAANSRSGPEGSRLVGLPGYFSLPRILDEAASSQ